MESIWRYTPDLVAMTAGAFLSWLAGAWLSGRVAPALRRWVRAGALISATWIALSFLFALPAVYRHWPLTGWLAWLKGFGIMWTLALTGAVAVQAAMAAARRIAPPFEPGRRAVIETVGALASAAPVAALGWGTYIERRDFRLAEVELRVPMLHRDLHGLRIVQITDTHMGDFFTRRDMEYAVGMANETKAHLALMTGDLISVRGDPLDECLRQLARVKAEAGLVGCLGNHEIASDCEDYVEREGRKLGLRFLRTEQEVIRFGSATMNIAGVDYQRRGKPYLRGAEACLRPGMLNVLLSHNPDVFPEAAKMGYHLTFSGHTHGGQVTVEILHQYLNVARFFTPYVYGVYEREGKSIYVSRGLGTVGAPVRCGAPPEVALIKLCAT